MTAPPDASHATDAASVLRIDAVTIFPAYLEPLRLSLLGRAAEAGLVEVRIHDLRDWTDDRHRTVDDTPAGGGAGMVMKPEPWAAAISSLLTSDADGGGPRPLLVVPTPSGTPFTQRDAEAWAGRSHLLIACGRYEGIDARVVDWAREDLEIDVAEVSIGDYVLAGGEAAAMVMIEAATRLVPGVLGNPASLTEESHGDNAPGLLEYPVYTRPRDWNGRAVPDVLMSGDHGAVARWRRDQSLLRTSQRRPELLAALPAGSLTRRDLDFLADSGHPVEPQP